MKRRYVIEVDWEPAGIAVDETPEALDDLLIEAVENYWLEVGSLRIPDEPKVILISSEAI